MLRSASRTPRARSSPRAASFDEQAANGCRGRLDPAIVEQESGLADQLGKAAGAGHRDHRHASRHRLDRRDAVGLAGRGGEEEIDAVE